jgi:hypothetical protein
MSFNSPPTALAFLKSVGKSVCPPRYGETRMSPAVLSASTKS